MKSEEDSNALAAASEGAGVPMAIDAAEPTELSVTLNKSQTDPTVVVDEKMSVVPVSAEADVPAEIPAVSNRWRGVQQLSRSFIPQPIPLEGTDSQTNSQPHLLEDIRIAYIFQAPMIRGKFDSKKAKQLGVPNGPIRGKLTAGQAIEIDDPENPGQKKTIHPEDVVGAPQDGGVSSFPIPQSRRVSQTSSQAAIVIDVDVQHITSLVEAPVLREYQIGGDKHANLVVHRVTTAVTRDPRYVEWASKFDEKTEVRTNAALEWHDLMTDVDTLQQIVAIIDELDDAITYTSSSWNLLRLNMLDKDIFKMQVVEKLEKERLPACK